MPFAAETDVKPLDHLVLCGRDDAPALILRDRLLDYGELRQRVALLSGWLRSIVNEPGARVAT